MKRKKILIYLCFTIIFSCSDRIWDNPNDPGSDNYNGGQKIGSVITSDATGITTNSAVLGGNVTSDGNTTITERGVVYSTSQNPTTDNNKVVIGIGKGIFSTTVSGLTANTTYYVRAYAINSQGTAYGSQISFTTNNTLTIATVTTSSASNITTTTATLGGNVIADGNATIMERGIVYSTSQHPTTANTKIVLGDGTGIFSTNVSGLAANTTYYVRAYAMNSQGIAYGNQVSFTTYEVIYGATAVYPQDNLAEIIANAASGDVLVLAPGEYDFTTGDVQITKSITIKGLLSNNKPILSVRFMINSGVVDFHLKDLDLMGTYGETPSKLAQAIFFNSGNYNVNSVTIESCYIRSYNHALIFGGSAVLKLNNLTITESILSDIVNDGGDFIDFRTGYVTNLSITNSTFNRVASSPRDFIRMDNSSFNFPGSTSKIVIDKCTFYNVSHSRRILYIRFISNESTVSNTIFAGLAGYSGYYSNQVATTNPECSRNNYFNALAFYTGSVSLDVSTTYTTLDPGFVDVAAGNFKITNQVLIDKQIGDPRWLK